MPLILINKIVTQPTTSTPAGGTVYLLVNTPQGQALPASGVQMYIAGLVAPAINLPVNAGGYYYDGAAIPPGDYQAIFTGVDASGPVSVPLLLEVDFSIYPLPELEAFPPAFAAAHLPMIAAIRATPQTVNSALVPAVLLMVAEVYRNSQWEQVGKSREVCDTLNYAYFDISEFIKTQFTETPPNESGSPDPALGIRYRGRFGLVQSFDGTTGTEQGSFAGLAINAAQVVNPAADPAPFPLLNPLPYGTVKPGYAGFISIANTSGVYAQNTGVESAADWPCDVRQFVWLHPTGAWAWGFFTGKHVHGTDVSDGTAVRRANGTERYVSGGEVRRTIQAYSDKITRLQYELLVTIRDSTQVWERLESGLYVPVLVDRGSFQDYQEGDKTWEVNFTARYPVLTRQTQ